MALVLYEEPVLARFHESEKSISIGTHTIKIKQDWARTGVAGVVWDAAVILGEYLYEHPELVRGRHVLELGAGTGFSGIVAAKIGAQRAILTDREKVLNILRENAALNGYSTSESQSDIEMCRNSEQRSENAATESRDCKLHDRRTSDMKDNCIENKDVVLNNCKSDAPCTCNTNLYSASYHKHSVKVEALEWGETIANPDFLEVDVILGADVIYIEETFPLLLKTLLDLTEDRNRLDKKSVVILLSCRIRYDKDSGFIAMLKQYFSVSQVLYDVKTDIYIYKAVRQ